MSVQNPEDRRLDHVVVLMFENRSFDHLLGYLYRPGEAGAFEGVERSPLSNPAPGAAGGRAPTALPVHESGSFAVPYPDPGEEFPHVNTQLFGTVDPESNRTAPIDAMKAPFNAPAERADVVPPMNGFVQDYISAYTAEMGRAPTEPELAQIMACYTPLQLPVLSGLAKGFTCFDHWFCEVPSQTYANRSFFHAATSTGFVNNGHPPGKFALLNDAPTIFNRLEEAGRSWRVYIDPRQFLPATGLIHARQLDRYFATNFSTIFDFFDDARQGELPNYSFIEPNMFHPHTDMHPHSGAHWAEDLHLKPPDTIIGGERLLADVYSAVKSLPTEGESNWANTGFLITFDEHGGTYDHVPPPSAIPPDSRVGEEGFGFDRLGVRIPTILVSAWVDSRTLVTSNFHSTSLIRTLRDWWGLGPPLTARDAEAPSLLPVLSRADPRRPEDWPEVYPRDLSLVEKVEDEFLRKVESLDSPMERLERDLLGDALAHEARVTGQPLKADPEQVSHRAAHDHFRRIRDEMFPLVATGRRS
jgi:phospholipase C